jgi:tetratricopeptide (TPR) repeat protein
MESGNENNVENEREIQEFEDELKSLVDAEKYNEAIEFSEKNSKIIYKYHGDFCKLYSYKIMGVCYLNNTRYIWKENGYKPSKWMAEGDLLFDKGDYEEAIEIYSKAREVDADKAWYAMGCAERARGNSYESVEYWDMAKSIHMKDTNAKKLEDNPHNAIIWAERGDIDYETNHWGSAINSYKNSLAIDSAQPEIWFKMGCSYYQIDQYHDAFESFKKVLELKPDHFRAANNAAVTLWNLTHNNQQVMEYFNQAANCCHDELIESHLIENNRKKAALQGDKIKIFTCFL